MTTNPHNGPRVFSALAYELLSRAEWPVYVSTDREYVAYSSAHGWNCDCGCRVQPPTDPGDTIRFSAYLRAMDSYSYPHIPRPATWEELLLSLDDSDGNVREYFIRVETPYGGNMVDWGDYCDCATWHRSNHRSLLRDYPGLFVELEGDHDSHGLMIPIMVPAEDETDPAAEFEYPHHAAHYDRAEAEAVADILTGLSEDYPVYDEDDMSTLETELVDEAVADDWFCRELTDDVAEALSERVLARLYPAACILDTTTGVFRATVRGVDTYRFTQALREFIVKADASGTITDPESGEPYHSLTSLFLTMYNAVCGWSPEHENATVDGVIFPNRAETIEAMADHLTGRTAVPTPVADHGTFVVSL